MVNLIGKVTIIQIFKIHRYRKNLEEIENKMCSKENYWALMDLNKESFPTIYIRHKNT